MKAISDAVISSISSARVARGEEGLSDDEVNDAREKASGIIDGAFADNAGEGAVVMLDIFGSDLLAGVSSLAIEPVTVVVIPVVVFATVMIARKVFAFHIAKTGGRRG